MKINWLACRLAAILLVGGALLATSALGENSRLLPAIQVGSEVSSNGVRIHASAAAPFEYVAARPHECLFVLDLAGVRFDDSTSARVLDSNVVSSYRVMAIHSGAGDAVRLEVLLRQPVEPKVERVSPTAVSVIVETTAKNARGMGGASTSLAAPVAQVVEIQDVRVSAARGQARVQIMGNGTLRYEALRLEGPERLVLDFSRARLALSKSGIHGNAKPVTRVRASQFSADTARIVIDLASAARYEIRPTDREIAIVFEARQKEATPSTALKPVGSDADTSTLPLPESLTRPAMALARAKGTETPKTSAGSAPVVPQEPAQVPAPAKYTGEPISVNLKDVDLKDFFRLIHEISSLNVVLDPNVKGNLTIVLDEVPWDQALEIVLQNNSLDKQLEGNVLRIATRETLKKEAEIKRDLAKAQAEAVPPVTQTRVLSYAKAASLRDTLKRFLTSRGELLADERSNMLIIRDIPSTLPVIDNLIRQLDRKGQQVEIESRVVAASRSFARDIGTQFAFSSTTTGGRSIFGGASGVGTSPLSCGTGGTGTTCPIPLPPLVVAGTTAMPLNTNLGATAPTSGASFSHRSPNFALDFVITAAESKGVGKLLSKPKVITQNNEKAVVKQGTKIPVQTTINNTISVQFIDAVLKLEVTPQITAEGTIFMEVLVENTQIDQGIPRIQGIPALNTQAVESKVLINDGGTVVIGGIIISSQRTDIQQVPLFGSLPLIGNLFKRTTVNVQSQELLFFVTPRIAPS